MNALAAAAVAEAMGCTAEEVQEGLESYRGTKWRAEIIEMNGLVILNDAYNSNPVSASAALELVRHWENARPVRRVAVLGDMLELGREAGRLHTSLGEQAVESGVELLIAVGGYAGHTAEGARGAGLNEEKIVVAEDVEGAWHELSPRLEPGDLVLLKASRGVGLERLVELIRGGSLSERTEGGA